MYYYPSMWFWSTSRLHSVTTCFSVKRCWDDSCLLFDLLVLVIIQETQKNYASVQKLPSKVLKSKIMWMKWWANQIQTCKCLQIFMLKWNTIPYIDVAEFEMNSISDIWIELSCFVKIKSLHIRISGKLNSNICLLFLLLSRNSLQPNPLLTGKSRYIQK